jgi:hypothetical protein
MQIWRESWQPQRKNRSQSFVHATQFLRKKNTMQIIEMRNSVDLENLRKGAEALPESAPDWVVRGIYERRNKLSLTPLPQGLEVRSMASFADSGRAQRAKAVVREHQVWLATQPETAEFEMRIQRLRAAMQ